MLWSLATLGTVWVHGYWMLYIRQALVGVGEATFGIFAPAVLADFYPERDRNRILSIFYVAIPVGAALGYLAGGEMGSALGLARAVLSLRHSRAGHCRALRLDGPRTRARRQRPRSPHRSIAPPSSASSRNPAFLTATFGLATLTFAMGGISAWVPTFLHRSAGLSVGNASLVVGAITVVDGIAGTLIGGWIAQRWLRTNHRALYLLSFWSVALTLPCGAAGLLRPARLGRSRALCRRVLPLPQHRPAQRRHRQLGLRPGPRHRHRLNLFIIHCFGDTFSPQIIGYHLRPRNSLRLGLGATLISLVVSGIISAGARFAPPLEEAATSD